MSHCSETGTNSKLSCPSSAAEKLAKFRCFERIISDALSKELDTLFDFLSFSEQRGLASHDDHQIESSTEDDRVKSGSLLMTRIALWYLI